MKKILFAIFCITFIACGNSSQNSNTTTQNEVAETQDVQPNESGSQHESTAGQVVLQIGDQEFEITRFRKNKTEISLTESQITIRLTDSEDERTLLINLQGPSLYADTPVKFEPISAGESENKATITAIGFNEREGRRDQILLKEGEINVTTLVLEDETPELELSFSGTGGPQRDFENEQSQTMNGSVSIEFDNKVDMR